MSTSNIQAAFAGKVEQNEYTQIYDFQTVLDSNGYILSRELVLQHVKESIFVFTGLEYSDAHTTDPVTVSDIAGTYTVPFKNMIRDGSTGTKVFEVYSSNVKRRRMSPHLWEVTVQVRESYYTVNGVRIELPND